MSKIGFGIRNLRVKKYPISYFNISEEEAESFSIKFNGFDIWNTNRKVSVKTPQIEKRVKYFHISFIPIFSTGTFWTTRKKDGLLYITNEKCERKILKKLKKVNSPWYSYFGIIVFTFFILFSAFDAFFLQDFLYQLRHEKKLEERSKNKIKLVAYENTGKPTFKIEQVYNLNRITLKNLNVPVELLRIENENENICNWEVILPQLIEANSDIEIKIKDINSKEFDSFVFKITLSDLNDVYEYRILKKGKTYQITDE